MLFGRFCGVYHLFWVCVIVRVQQALSWLWPWRRGSELQCREAIATTTKAVKYRNNSSTYFFPFLLLSRWCCPSRDWAGGAYCSNPALTHILSPFPVSLSPIRCSTRGAGRAIIQGPVQPGAPEASGGLSAPVCRALLPGGEPDPPQWCCQTFTGTQRCHPGPGPERPVRHWPGPTGHWEGSDQHAYTHGEWRWQSRLSMSTLFCTAHK